MIEKVYLSYGMTQQIYAPAKVIDEHFDINQRLFIHRCCGIGTSCVTDIVVRK